MPLELRPLRRRLRLQKSSLGYVGHAGGRAVLAAVTGVGTSMARAATIRLLDAVDIDWVVVIGITGGLDEQIPIGTLVLPEDVVNAADGSRYRATPLRVGDPQGTMWTTDELLTDPTTLDELKARGVVSLDMETAAIAEVCDARGVAWSVVRAISDLPGSVDSDIAGLTHPDGTAKLAAVARYAATHPSALFRLSRLARGARLAARRAADAAIMAASRSLNS